MRQISTQILLTAPMLILVCAPTTVGAILAADDPAHPNDVVFERKLQDALATFARSDDPHIRHLIEAVRAAPGTVRIREMTDDHSTWSSDGDPARGHTEPNDGRPKRAGRTAPANATVFIPRDAVETSRPHWRSGVLIHELVHALDLATGRYDRDYTVRERRASFIQNVWRHLVGSPLRTSYHGEFATRDYQHASRSGTIAEYANYVFTRADFPASPPDATPRKPAVHDRAHSPP